MGKWFKRKLGMIALALNKVQGNAINNTGDSMDSIDASHNRFSQGRLSDSLINGEVTEEVKELRWRMYKVIKKSVNLKTQIIGYDLDGLPITKTTNTNRHKLDKVKVDDFDNHKVILVVNNGEITLSTKETLDFGGFTEIDAKVYKPYDSDTDILNPNNLGVLSNDNYVSNVKTCRPIKIDRDSVDIFNLETYTDKMVVRDMEDGNFLLELYISKYPDYGNRKTVFLIKSLKEALTGIKLSFFFINKISFLSSNTIGSDDNLYYEYEIVEYDKTISYNGFYVVKFKARALINGEDVTNAYLNESLEFKYDNKIIK